MVNNFNILDSITESMAVINSEGQIIFTNKAWRDFSAENRGDDASTGVNNNYLSTCEAVKGEETRMAMDAKTGIQQVIDRKFDKFELEYPCHSPTEKRWFILRVTQVLENPDLTLMAHINITNRKMAELEIEKNYKQSLILNERLQTTLQKIVHDIQNPLASIMGLINLSKSENDKESVREYLDLIGKGSANLRSFVKDTLKHIASIGDVQAISMEQIVTKYLETIPHLLNQNAIELKLDIQQDGNFYTNENELQSILSNLVSNAIKYSDPLKSNKFIALHFKSDENKGVLQVADNGLGIKKEDIPKLMNRNYQVNQESSEGVGLGLFLVQKSIRNLEGFIKINSDIGVGTTFTIEIPNKIKPQN